MEQKPAPRKMKFAPRAPPKRPPKPAGTVKSEPVESDNNSAQAMDLLRRINEGSLRKPKIEKKVSTSQVAWMGGVANSTRSNGYQNSARGSSRAGAYGWGTQEEQEYKEPWDYYSYYPVTLPARRPYSGNPEVLDEEEFGQASENAMYHENSINSASELDLLEDSIEPRMILMQLPTVPMVKRSTQAEATTSSRPSPGEVKACGVNKLPGGLMGKILVYRSGAVKLKIGDVLYDMKPGLKCEFAQDVVAVNTMEKECCLVGELNKHAVLTPDLDSLLNSIDDM